MLNRSNRSERWGRQPTEPAALASLAGLAVRARMHAALGELVRLAIVDQLALGDASPGELGAVTGLATNLLAFHLRVLEDAGLIRRIRSEGDRRRSYVQLRWDDVTVAELVRPDARALPGPVPRVVFVCTRNSDRSQLAAAIWPGSSPIPVACAGTRPSGRIHPRTVEVGRRHGLQLDRARTHHVAATVRPGDLVVAVCDQAHEELAAARPGPRPGWLHWAVADPARDDTDDAFETAYTDLSHRISRLAATLNPRGTEPSRTGPLGAGPLTGAGRLTAAGRCPPGRAG